MVQRVGSYLGYTGRGGNAFWSAVRDVVAEEAQAVGLVCGDELVQEQSAKQAREHAHGEEEAGPARYPALATYDLPSVSIARALVRPLWFITAIGAAAIFSHRSNREPWDRSGLRGGSDALWPDPRPQL